MPYSSPWPPNRKRLKYYYYPSRSGTSRFKSTYCLFPTVTQRSIHVLTDKPHSCLRNVVSMFHVIEKEMEWRRQHGQPEGFETMKEFKPIVAIGAEQPLEDQRMMADYYRIVAFLSLLTSSTCFSTNRSCIYRRHRRSRRHPLQRTFNPTQH